MASLAGQVSRYPLLSKRILDSNTNDILINFVALRHELNDDFTQLPAHTKTSFYFEYLPDGTAIHIGADTNLVAASLIKTPLAMNVYKAAELGRLNLNKPVTVTANELDGGYGSWYQRGPGFQVTLRQAAQAALEQSDDTAMHVMFDHVNNLLNYDQQSLAGLDIAQDLQNGQAVINARSYSSVLKSLYFASYLNKTDSQQLLSYLTMSTEHSRLTKYLPKSLTVAHKNGVNNVSWAESDCGIVYVPKRPYIICAMIGLPDPQASNFIADISKQVYDYVTQQ
jgi:beta-lactamase class A